MADTNTAPNNVLTTALARQSIVDDKGEVFAYELFNRSTGNQHSSSSDAAVLFRVLSDAGVDAMFGRKNLFVNCTLESLSGTHLELIHPEQVVLEVPPVPHHVLAEIVVYAEQLRRLKDLGFRLAFDHSVLTKPYTAWLQLATFIKLDLAQIPEVALPTFVALAQKNSPAKLIAEKVETKEQQEKLHSLGVGLFQGYWFSKPVMMQARLVSPSQTTIIQLINLVRRHADPDEIETLLKTDPTLSFNLLRFINSSGFGLNVEITSFKHAVMILGLKKLFRWASMLLSAARSGGAPPAAGNLAVLRGRLMENLAVELMPKEEADNAFVVGVFSLLDTMLNMPMEQALASLSLPQSVLDALIHRTGPFAPFLHVVEICETGSAEEVTEAAENLTLTAHQVNMAHLEAMAWAEQLLDSNAHA